MNRTVMHRSINKISIKLCHDVLTQLFFPLSARRSPFCNTAVNSGPQWPHYNAMII